MNTRPAGPESGPCPGRPLPETQSQPQPRPNRACRWTRDRLPLLAGGELVAADRRRAERHLIACPACRRRHADLDRALSVLHAAAAVTPFPLDHDMPSLWPALERQIREERHTRRGRLSLTEPFSWLYAMENLGVDFLRGQTRFRLATVAFALAVGGLGATGLGVWAGRQITAARVAIAEARQPIHVDVDPFAADFPPALLAITPASAPGVVPGDSVADRDQPAASRLDYDLDRGTPMGPDARDAGLKPSY